MSLERRRVKYTHLALAKKVKPDLLDGIPSPITNKVQHSKDGIQPSRLNHHCSDHRIALAMFLAHGFEDGLSGPEHACYDKNGEEYVERDRKRPVGRGEPHNGFCPDACTRLCELRDEHDGAT